MRGRTVAYLVITMMLTAGIVTNLTFKSLWGRPRPAAVVEFNGQWQFKHWWQPGGECPKNCSFFSGEAATAFWTYAPASLAPPPWRPLAYAGATVFGLATGGLRVAFGGHFVSDVLVAGLVTFLLIWLVHGLLYRWPSTRTTDERIEAWLTGLPGRDTRWLRKLLGRKPTRPDPDKTAGFSPSRIYTSDPTSGHDASRPQTSHRTFAPSLALTAVLLARADDRSAPSVCTIPSVDLFFDESQYWAWSRELAFGYFSKPPLLAWIIAASSAVCGDGEACARAASPILYFGTSLVIYAIAEELYDARTAFWSALAFTLLPGVVFSTRIISTDVPLLFCWALALLAWVKLLRAADWRWAVVLGGRSARHAGEICDGVFPRRHRHLQRCSIAPRATCC